MDCDFGNYVAKEKLLEINSKIIECRTCPRLSEHIRSISFSTPKRFRNVPYWARPVPSFGDPNAKLLIIGLAPAAHGGNRTGRMFTGDSSGDWVARALFQTGFASSPVSKSINDGFTLKDTYITAVTHCAPPYNRPTHFEIASCSTHLRSEVDVLDNTVRVIITLGHIAFQTYCRLIGIAAIKFRHGGRFNIKDDKVLLSSYHPSRQNTNTGRLTWRMWIEIFKTARIIMDSQHC